MLRKQGEEHSPRVDPPRQPWQHLLLPTCIKVAGPLQAAQLRDRTDWQPGPQGQVSLLPASLGGPSSSSSWPTSFTGAEG